MRAIVDGAGRLVALGGDSLAPGPGQEARETARTLADFAAAEALLPGLGGPGEVWHDPADDQFKVRARAATDAESCRAVVVAAAQSAVGLLFSDLTAAQVRALAACLLYRAGALDRNGVVRPLGAWLR